MTAAKKTPDGLNTSGRRLWADVQGDYALDVHEELLLLQACRTADRLDRLEVEAANAPVTVENHRGDQVTHPAMVEARQQSITLARLLAAMRMPSGDETGRPQHRAVRGAYGVRSVAS